MQANFLPTLLCLLWCRGMFQVKGLEKTHFHEPGVAGTIDLTFDRCQHYWKCLQQSKSRRKSMCSRVDACFDQNETSCQYCPKKPNF